MAEPNEHGPSAPPEGSVDREIGSRAVLGFVIFLFVLVAFSMVLMWGIQKTAKKEISAAQPPAPPLAGARENPLPPAPRLETSPAKDLADLRERENAVMTQYAWVDKPRGIAQIPVDRAIEIAAKSGLPVRYGPTPAAAQGTSKGAPK
jgi:hypothetical protein